jgi:hypothetical protein
MTVKDVAKELKLNWHTVKTLDKEYMQEQLRRNPVAAPRSIGTDEISLRKGHTYRTVRILRLMEERLFGNCSIQTSGSMQLIS